MRAPAPIKAVTPARMKADIEKNDHWFRSSQS
jgi:hypothetical protein